MPASQSDVLVRQWRERFRSDALASTVVSGLRTRREEIWHSAVELLRRESPEYRNSIDAEFSRESKQHCGELLHAITAIADGKAKRTGGDSFDFVRTHAQWRARHHVPLIASLHAYRLAHRTYWEMTREPLLRHSRQEQAIRSLTMLSDFWIELFDHVGAVLAEAHAIEESLIVAQNTRAYVGLIDDLLRGVEPDNAEARRLCALCGIRPGAPLAVAVARPLQSHAEAHVDIEVTLRSTVRFLEQALPSADFGKLIDIREREIVAILCCTADTGRAAVAALNRGGFARRGRNGLSLGIGISLDATAVARLPEALHEAQIALDFAHADRPLLLFSGVDLPEFLIRRAEDAALRLIPEWVHRFDLGDRQSAELWRTVRTFADCNFNVKQTARRLSLHTNTVYFRLNRIEKLSGVDPRTFSGTTLLLTALRLLEVRGARGRGVRPAASTATYVNPVARVSRPAHS